MSTRYVRSTVSWMLSAALAYTAGAAAQQQQVPQSPVGESGARQTVQPGNAPPGNASASERALRVCADPHGMPQSNDRGEGYENKIAEALAQDLGKKVEYTFFPQRMGFVRNTLRARDEQTLQYKCDLIIGVPKGYELTATTQPYMHSIYAVVLPARDDFKNLHSAEDLLKLPTAKLHQLRIGLFAQTPAADWVLKNGLIDNAVMYAAQSGDPKETPNTIIERDLAARKIDMAIVWGPVAGFLVSQHTDPAQPWMAVPFRPDPTIKFDYEISMGLRQGEKDWQNTLDQWIAAHQAKITEILTAYHIPLIQETPSPKG